MSHVTTINLMVKDLDALERACARLGLEVVRGQKTYKWYGTWVNDYNAQDAAYQNGIDTKDYGKCDHAIRVKGSPTAYEVGLVKQDGGYRLVWDFYGGGNGLVEKISYETRGKNANKLNDWYAAEVARKTMSKQGWKVTATQEQGKVKVLCRK